MVEPGRLIRERRLAHGLTQAQLALRAGTTQTALSWLERGDLSPTFATVQRLLFVPGEPAELDVRPLAGDHDPAHLADLLARPAAERLELAMSWNRLAGEVAIAGRAGCGTRVTVSIAGRDDLIAMKRASGRPIDRGDVIALTVAERDAPADR